MAHRSRSPHIAWAGDLDRDGSIDIFAELQTDYCGRTYALFLSSAAKGGLAPARVATLGTHCC